MPSISESQTVWETSSQEACQDGSWHNSDAAANAIHAAKLERALRNAAPAQPSRPQNQQIASFSEGTGNTWKNLFHKASMACGLAILPSFALLALGPLGLLAPACLALAFITLALLGGKPSEAIQATRARRAVEVANSDNRVIT